MSNTDFIEVYEGAFSDEICDTIVRYFEYQKRNGHVLGRKEATGACRLNISDTSAFIPEPYTLVHDNVVIDAFNSFFVDSFNKYFDKYSLEVLGELSNHLIKVQKTKPKEGYHTWHCEQGAMEVANRIIAWVLYLNDDFEAGETEFLYQQKRVKPSKGTVVFFPAYYTHMHRGNPPIGGDKYIATGWLTF